MKNLIKKIINQFLELFSKTSIGKYVHKSLIDQAMSKTSTIIHNDEKLIFSTPNTLNAYRVTSFSSKEPETLEWIDGFEKDSVFWDIGANIGLYSCYAAQKRNAQVISFEPSVFNLELLARNIYLNELNNLITIIPIPLTHINGKSSLNMTTTEWGGALSTFGEKYGQDGEDLNQVFKFNTFGLKMDYLLDFLDLKLPKYIKIDVDGIEHLVLKGGPKILSQIDSILIEIDDDFSEQSKKCIEFLNQSGLTFIEKRQSDESIGTCQYNQIWRRIKNES